MNGREHGVECRECGYFGPPLVFQSREDASWMGLAGRGAVRFAGLFVPGGGTAAESLLDTDAKYAESECPNCRAQRPQLILRRGEISDEAWAIYNHAAAEIAEDADVRGGCIVVLVLVVVGVVAFIVWRIVTVP